MLKNVSTRLFLTSIITISLNSSEYMNQIEMLFAYPINKLKTKSAYHFGPF